MRGNGQDLLVGRGASRGKAGANNDPVRLVLANIGKNPWEVAAILAPVYGEHENVIRYKFSYCPKLIPTKLSPRKAQIIKARLERVGASAQLLTQEEAEVETQPKRVVLLGQGAAKGIPVIKAIRSYLQLHLKPSKAAWDNVPTDLGFLPKMDAETLVKHLTQLGAEARALESDEELSQGVFDANAYNKQYREKQLKEWDEKTAQDAKDSS